MLFILGQAWIWKLHLGWHWTEDKESGPWWYHGGAEQIPATSGFSEVRIHPYLFKAFVVGYLELNTFLSAIQDAKCIIETLPSRSWGLRQTGRKTRIHEGKRKDMSKGILHMQNTCTRKEPLKKWLYLSSVQQIMLKMTKSHQGKGKLYLIYLF